MKNVRSYLIKEKSMWLQIQDYINLGTNPKRYGKKPYKLSYSVDDVESDENVIFHVKKFDFDVYNRHHFSSLQDKRIDQENKRAQKLGNIRLLCIYYCLHS